MKKQEVRLIKDSSEKMVPQALEKIMDEGYHIDQLLPLSKTTFLAIISKQMVVKKKVAKKTVKKGADNGPQQGPK